MSFPPAPNSRALLSTEPRDHALPLVDIDSETRGFRRSLTHGYGVLLPIQQISGGALAIQQGALYPALYRLERQGLIESEWGTSDNNRRAKFYRLTAAGRARLGEEAPAGTGSPMRLRWR